MNLRIGSIVISVNFIFLVAAFAFFLRLSYQRLYPNVFSRRAKASAVLVTVSLAGILGSLLYGLLGEAAAGETPMLPIRAEFPFGSFGGYWGVILGSLVMSSLFRVRHLPQADAFVPGILVGGAIARLAGLFNNANPGITIHLEAFHWFQPFKFWAAYDILIHLAVLALVWRWSRRLASPRGLALTIFLIGYGFLRFALEFLRDTEDILGIFTYGHIMAGIQTMAGVGLAGWIYKDYVLSITSSTNS